MSKEQSAVVIPSAIYPTFSSIVVGNIGFGQPLNLEVTAECGLEKSEDEKNIYYLDTLVRCCSEDTGFQIMVGVRAKVFALGDEETIFQSVKNVVRDDTMSAAEDMIYKVGYLHGIPLRIDLLEHIREDGYDEEE